MEIKSFPRGTASEPQCRAEANMSDLLGRNLDHLQHTSAFSPPFPVPSFYASPHERVDFLAARWGPN